MKRIFAALVALATLGGSAYAGTITSVTGPQDPSQLNATINGLIRDGNNYWSPGGRRWLESSTITSNATSTVTITNVGPAGMATSTIIEWMRIRNPSGAWRFIPLWGCGGPTC